MGDIMQRIIEKGTYIMNLKSVEIHHGYVAEVRLSNKGYSIVMEDGYIYTDPITDIDNLLFILENVDTVSELTPINNLVNGHWNCIEVIEKNQDGKCSLVRV